MAKRFKQCSAMFLIGTAMAQAVRFAGDWIVANISAGWVVLAVLYNFAIAMFFFGAVLMLQDYYEEYKERQERKKKFKLLV